MFLEDCNLHSGYTKSQCKALWEPDKDDIMKSNWRFNQKVECRRLKIKELDDSQLRIISDELDLTLQRLCLEHKLHTIVESITLARLIHLNGVVDSKNDLGKLLLSIGDSIIKNELDKPESIH
jgi:hypothetical protein